MILSFSVPEMLPYIRTGLLQAKGENVGNARVKRQTIRRMGPQAERTLWLIEEAGMFPYDLSLWWKSRTKERECIGAVEAERVQAFPVEISNADDQVFMRGPIGWRPQFTSLGWCPDRGGDEFAKETYADGFDGPEAFRDYFVPNAGDIFKGILYRW